MSYYKPNYSGEMSRGRGGYSSRGSTYRGNHSRGSRGSYGGSHGRGHSHFSSSFERSKYTSSERYSSRTGGGSKFDEYRRPSFRSGSHSRERSPDRKKPRVEGYSSRHDNSYGSSGSRYESSYIEPRRSTFPSSSSSSRKPEEFRRPSSSSTPYSTSRGGGGPFRGRGNRGSRIMRARERLPPMTSRGSTRRLLDSSYGIRKNYLSTTSRSNDYTRRLKISKMRSAIAARRTNHKSEDEANNSEDDDKNEEKKPSVSVKEEDEENDDAEAASPAKEANTTGGEKSTDSVKNEEERPKKSLIKLICPHCNVRCITFRKYEIHLTSRTHMISMKKVALKQKAILSQMRQAQRSAQNELEKTSNEDLQGRTNFCPLCKLNYKQKKSVHQSSEAHKNMKKFLMPFCKVCSVTFKSPMMFESHCCSIEHIKRKQRMENEASSDESNECGDLENFTTIDSVGELDEVDEEIDAKKEENPSEIVNVGIENIKKIEAYYCDLCKMFLPKAKENEMPKLLAKHCKLLGHMKRYIRFKEDKDLEERALKLQKKETEEKEAAKIKKENDEKDDGSSKVDKPADGGDGVFENKDDKMWDEVDKDLGDILADAEDDDEEDSIAKTKERYDRFKLSEKNGEETLKDLKEDENEDALNGKTSVDIMKEED